MKNLRQLFRRSGLPSTQKRRRRSETTRPTHRRLSNEVLEKRQLLAGDIGDVLAPAHNYWNPYDVNDDGHISARDALGIINHMDQSGGEPEAIPEDLTMFYDVNADHSVTPADALGVINAMSRGEEVGELVELIVTARDLNDNPIAPDANGEINLEVGQQFDIEVSYDDLRTFGDRRGVFQLYTDIAVSQSGVLSPVLNETQRLIIDSTITSVPSTGVTFTIPEAPPGITGGMLSYTSPIDDFGNDSSGEVANALRAFGFTTNQFDITEIDIQGDLGFDVHFVGDEFGNIDQPDIMVEVNETNPADDIPATTIPFDPFLADGVTPNTAAVKFNINTESRTLNNPSDDEELYSLFPRGEFDPASGFSDLGGLVKSIGQTRIQELSNDGQFREPFDAFSFRVFVNAPVTDLVIGVNPGEATEATLLFGRDDPVPQDMVLIETDPAGDVAGNGIANITINTVTPADPTVSVTVNPAAVDEDGSNVLTYTFTRAGDADEALDVTYTVGGTATAGDDFAAPPGTVTIPANQTTATVTIDPTDDTDVEPDETIILTVTDGSNYDVGSPNSATGIINNDDQSDDPTVSVDVSPAAVLEDGTAALTYTFTRTGDASQALNVSYTVDGTATSGDDFTALSGTVTIPANQTVATVTVDPTDDTDVEPNETIILTVTDGTNYDVGSPNSATGTITNDDQSADPLVSIAVSPAAVLEDGTGSLTYTFTRSGDASQALNVSYTVSGTATEGIDFAAQSGSVTIPANQTSATVTIDPTDDTDIEPNETIILTVTDGSNYNVGNPDSATGTITNDDQAADPTVSISVSPTSVNEDGAGTLTYTFTRSGDASQTLNVSYTVGGTATQGTDFPTQSGTVSIPANQTTATVTINPIDDTDIEPNETIVLTVTDGSNYDVGTPNTATGTIINDDIVVADPTVSVSVSPTAVDEDGSGALIYTFTRSGDASQALSVTYNVGGTATQGIDFPTQSGTVTIGANQTTATVTIDPIDDSVVEPNETIVLTVTDGANYDVGTPSSAQGTIINDDVVVGPGTATITGHIFIDEVENVQAVIHENEAPFRNGDKDIHEKGIGGLPVHLTGDGVSLTVYTDFDGSFGFTGLAAGTYTVRFDKPSTILSTAPTSHVVVIPSVDNFTSTGHNFPAIGTTGSALETVDIISTSYLRTNGEVSELSNKGRQGGVASLSANGNMEFIVIADGFEGVSFAELVLNAERDAALLTVIKGTDVLTARLSNDHFVVTADGRGVQFFGGMEDFVFTDADSVTPEDEFVNFRNAIDLILATI